MKPDVEKVDDKFYKVYYQGMIYDINRMANHWAISRPGHLDETMYYAETIDDAIALLSCTGA